MGRRNGEYQEEARVEFVWASDLRTCNWGNNVSGTRLIHDVTWNPAYDLHHGRFRRLIYRSRLAASILAVHRGVGSDPGEPCCDRVAHVCRHMQYGRLWVPEPRDRTLPRRDGNLHPVLDPIDLPGAVSENMSLPSGLASALDRELFPDPEAPGTRHLLASTRTIELWN